MDVPGYIRQAWPQLSLFTKQSTPHHLLIYTHSYSVALCCGTNIDPLSSGCLLSPEETEATARQIKEIKDAETTSRDCDPASDLQRRSRD